MRFRMSASYSENNAAASRSEVSSVRVEPSISGTSGDTVDAAGKNGCCGTALPSTVGEKPCVI